MGIIEKIKTGECTLNELSDFITFNLNTAKQLGLRLETKIKGKCYHGFIYRGDKLLTKKSTFSNFRLPSMIAQIHAWFYIEMERYSLRQPLSYGLDGELLFNKGIGSTVIVQNYWYACEDILKYYPDAVFPDDKVRMLSIGGRERKAIIEKDIRRNVY